MYKCKIRIVPPQQPHHYQQYKFGGGITGAGIAEEKPIVFHWDEPETYQNHHVQPQLHPRGAGSRSQVACSQPLSEYPFEQQNFGFTLGEDPLPPPVPPRLPTKPPPLPLPLQQPPVPPLPPPPLPLERPPRQRSSMHIKIAADTYAFPPLTTHHPPQMLL